VYPWVLSLVERALDPLSRAQCACLADMASQLLEYDLSSDKSNLLLQKVFMRFSSQLKAICLPSLRSSADLHGHGFLIYQLWQVSVCLDNVSLFKSLLSPAALARLVWHAFSLDWCSVISSVLSFVAANCKVSTSNNYIIILQRTMLVLLIRLPLCVLLIRLPLCVLLAAGP
jgi:hypothetical protein